MAPNMFVYGSLMNHEVLRILLTRVPRNEKAALNGFRRCQIAERSYPGVIEDSTTKVDGVVLLGLSDREVGILDEFEGDEYERVSTKVFLEDESCSEMQASVYKYIGGQALDTEWDYEHFLEHHLEDFIASFRGFPGD